MLIIMPTHVWNFKGNLNLIVAAIFLKLSFLMSCNSRYLTMFVCLKAQENNTKCRYLSHEPRSSSKKTSVNLPTGQLATAQC